MDRQTDLTEIITYPHTQMVKRQNKISISISKFFYIFFTTILHVQIGNHFIEVWLRVYLSACSSYNIWNTIHY